MKCTIIKARTSAAEGTDEMFLQFLDLWNKLQEKKPMSKLSHLEKTASVDKINTIVIC